jgi:DNA-binding transcriptional ArsR family regulator
MEIFEVLGDAVRRRILELLAERPRTAGELSSAFDISRPAVSRHLRVLRESRLVRYEADAQRRIYRLDPRGFTEAEAWLTRHRRAWESSLDDLETRVVARRSARERARNDRETG